MKLINMLNPFYVYERRASIKPSLKNEANKLVASVLGWLAVQGYPVDSNARKLASMKNIHRGKRGFVIGNGPSLTMNDLSKLTGEITIASNKIYLAFDKTDWRPTYYSIIDSIVAENIADEAAKLSMTKFFPAGFYNNFKALGNALFCNLLKDWYELGHFAPGFSDNIVKGIYAGEAVTYWNVQILWFLGIREIYLIGVDHSFILPSEKIPDDCLEYILIGEGESNHFDKQYRPVNEKWTMPHLDEIESSFAFARSYIENKSGILKNASRRTKLSCLERIDFDLLTGGMKFDEVYDIQSPG